MSLKIDQGLFTLDFTDYHAILGIAVDADVKDIRKRYLTIARRLHPDSCVTEDQADRQRASELLSKLVNPAYEKLSQEKNYVEYGVLLRLKGQQALKQQDTVVLTSDSARRLAAASDLDNSYRAAIKALADQQYQQLDRMQEITGQISELNLVYLMRKEGRGESVRSQPKQAAPASGAPATPKPSTPTSSTAKAPPTKSDLVASYMRRAQEFENKHDYPKAILELRDAIKMDPTNSDCHSRLGVIYLKTNQVTMAKIHFNKALELNPQDAVALEGKRRIESPNGGKTTSAAKPEVKGAKPDSRAKKPDSKGGKSDTQGSGGLFGLFGGKKK